MLGRLGVCGIPCLAVSAVAQTPLVSPRLVLPERPTVATHAYAVAPAYVELEQGVRVQQRAPTLTTWEFNLKIGLARHAQLGIFGVGFAHTGGASGLGDMGAALKLRGDLGPRAAVALIPAATLPTGDAARGLGAGRALGALIGVLSADGAGGMHVDVNAGTVGIGAGVPRGFATFCPSRAVGPFTFAAELYGFSAGGDDPAQGGLLAAVSVRLAEWAALDGGAVLGLGALSRDQLFLGLTTNLGRAF